MSEILQSIHKQLHGSAWDVVQSAALPRMKDHFTSFVFLPPKPLALMKLNHFLFCHKSKWFSQQNCHQSWSFVNCQDILCSNHKKCFSLCAETMAQKKSNVPQRRAGNAIGTRKILTAVVSNDCIRKPIHTGWVTPGPTVPRCTVVMHHSATQFTLLSGNDASQEQRAKKESRISGTITQQMWMVEWWLKQNNRRQPLELWRVAVPASVEAQT